MTNSRNLTSTSALHITCIIIDVNRPTSFAISQFCSIKEFHSAVDSFFYYLKSLLILNTCQYSDVSCKMSDIFVFRVFGSLQKFLWKHHTYRWRAANFELCLVFMAIENWGFFSVKHPHTHPCWRAFRSVVVAICFNDLGFLQQIL